jgi:membrane protease YdiL (CAAX protease family)
MNISYALFLLFFGPIHEEMGWRGIALPELNKIYSFNTSVLYLGIMWAIWHLPLFFIENTYQNQLGLFNLSFWNFMLSIIFTSVIYGLIYFKTEGSILPVILFHYIGNLSGETFILTAQSETFTTVLRFIFALIILYYYRDNNIYRYKNNP